ncbi:hypothetical protein TNCV_3827641 [Trichonephila clavipes]|nr:hypothetical protein TNCV_3827641 [Trichonephila clavipes]
MAWGIQCRRRASSSLVRSMEGKERWEAPDHLQVPQAHEGQGLLRPSQYTGPLSAEVHEQVSLSGGLSEARPQTDHCSRDEKLSRLAQPGNRTRTCGVEA